MSSVCKRTPSDWKVPELGSGYFLSEEWKQKVNKQAKNES